MERKVDHIPLAVYFADGTVGVMRFITRQYIVEYGVQTTEWEVAPSVDNIKAVIAKANPALPPGKAPIKSWEFIFDTDIPEDRTYRDAWTKQKGKKIEVDMVKARDIQREHLRREREGLFAKLDQEYMRADEEGDITRKKAIALEKKALRDLPAHPDIEAASTPDELKELDAPRLLGPKFKIGRK